MRMAMLLGALLVAGTAHAANLNKLDGLDKQAEKLGRGEIGKAKVLCVCHLPDGTSRLGFIGANPAGAPTEVYVHCFVPAYDSNGDWTDIPTCATRGGASWEIVK